MEQSDAIKEVVREWSERLATERLAREKAESTAEKLWRCLIEAAKPNGNLCQLLRERNLERACKALGVAEE